MNPARVKLPDKEILAKLLARDETALAHLYEAYADILLRYLKIKFRTSDEQTLQACICDSLIAFSEHPYRYKAHHASLKTYLVMDIQGDILNKLDKEKRARKQNKIVALLPEHENNNEEAEALSLSDGEAFYLKEQVKGFFKSVFNDPSDEKLAWMIMVEKTRETSAYTKLLEIEHFPVEEQQIEVKKHKDRISVQLRRKGWMDFTKNLKRNASK